MPTPIRESVLAAAAAELETLVPAVPVERARRAPVAIAEMPRLVVTGLGMEPDEGQSPLETFWKIGFSVTGYASGATDLAAEQALTELHARVVAALQAADLGPGAVQPTAGFAEMALYDAEASSKPAGQFTVVFEVLAVTPTSSPYAP